jgi:hypothetical protein
LIFINLWVINLNKDQEVVLLIEKSESSIIKLNKNLTTNYFQIHTNIVERNMINLIVKLKINIIIITLKKKYIENNIASRK